MQIINKRKNQGWVKFDRSLMRDTRLKSHHKVLYLLLCSLSDTCDQVYPTYSWIASEVGYQYSGKAEVGSYEYEDALQKFVSANLEPLINLGWIKKINKQGKSCDYEIYDHDCDPGEKSPNTPEKNLLGNPREKSPTSKKDIYSYIKNLELNQDLELVLIKFIEMRKRLKKLPTEEAINLIIKKLNNFDLTTQIKMIENSIINGWTGIFEIKPNFNQQTRISSSNYPPVDIYQYDDESNEEFQERANKRQLDNPNTKYNLHYTQKSTANDKFLEMKQKLANKMTI